LARRDGAQWRGRGNKAVEIAAGSVVWYSGKFAKGAIAPVSVRDPQRKRDPQTFLCTDKAAKTEQILLWFIYR
jgi:hypothetical protein